MTGVRREQRGAGRDSADTAIVTALDEAAGLALSLEIELHRSGVLRTRAALTSTRPGRYWLEHLTLLLPVPEETTDLLDFTGHHLGERSPQRTAFTHGLRVRENRTGRTGYDSAHVLCAGMTGFANRRGQVWGVHIAFSGNSRTIAERTFHGRSAVGGGELLLPGEVGLELGETYTSPWVYGSYGAEGLDELSGRFHEFLRSRPHRPATPRPVIANTWEAVYFDHNLDRLSQLAKAAAAAGAGRSLCPDRGRDEPVVPAGDLRPSRPRPASGLPRPSAAAGRSTGGQRVGLGRRVALVLALGVRLPGHTLGAVGLRTPVLYPDHVLLVRATAVDA